MNSRIQQFFKRCLHRLAGQWALPVVSALLLASPLAVQAAGGGVPLDRFPTAKLSDQAALQNGAKLFVNYCLGCHSANLMRYNRLTDIGLTVDQIRSSLMFTADKVGDPMRIAMAPKDAKAWFGAMPPDLSVAVRARASRDGSGADWVYSYLRSYYRDATRATGWNNAVFPNVGMPHVLWELQGTRGATFEEVRAVADSETGHVTGHQKVVVQFDEQGHRSEISEAVAAGHAHEGTTVKLGTPAGGHLSPAQFDEQIADLVAFLTYMSDPSAQTRERMAVWVLLFLMLFTASAWWLNREYWKDIK